MPEFITLTCAGSTAKISVYAANVVSWNCKGKERLFFSKQADLDKPGIEIFGGIPIVFPHFGGWGEGRPQHGFARLMTWEVESVGESECVLKLVDNEYSRRIWDNQFCVMYTISLSATSLKCALNIQNKNRTAPFDFTTLFHTYVGMPDVRESWIVGLGNTKYWDATDDPSKTYDKVHPEPLRVLDWTDRVYDNSAASLTFAFDGNVLKMTKSESLPNTVVWNPWAKMCHDLPNIDDNDFNHMLAIEFGKTRTAKTLQPSEIWECSQILEIL